MTRADHASVAWGRSRAGQHKLPLPDTGFPELIWDGRAARLPYASCRFPGTPSRVAEVRAYIRRLLDGHPALDAVVLAASELATNAIDHTASGLPGGAFSVRVAALDDTTVALMVWDAGAPTGPEARPAGVDDEYGRGLTIVEAVSDWCTVLGDWRGRGVLAVLSS